MATVDDVTNTVEPIIKSVDTTVVNTVAAQITEPGFFVELGYAVFVLVLVISVHGWCMGADCPVLRRPFRQVQCRHTAMAGQPADGHDHRASRAVASVRDVHLGRPDLVPGPDTRILRDAYFFVLEAYTTLGEGKVTLPERLAADRAR